MKSNASAGFKSKPLPEGIAATHGTQPVIEEKKEKSEEEQFKELEEEVHRLLEQSSAAKVNKNKPASWVVNALVEATPISTPARVM